MSEIHVRTPILLHHQTSVDLLDAPTPVSQQMKLSEREMLSKQKLLPTSMNEKTPPEVFKNMKLI
jgi:hypothetical protein